MMYRKKPVVIEAHQLTRHNFMNIREWMKSQCELVGDFSKYVVELSIHTLEGTMIAHEYDYIIKGIRGEFYPCKPDIFEASYEKVEDVR